MEIANLYIRKFSEIDGMQKKQTIEYNLCSETIGGKTVYGINVFSEETHEEKTYLISDSIETVRLFIKYVYENSVKEDVVEDLVSDFLYMK